LNLREREKAMTLQLHQTAYIYRMQFARSGSISYVGHLDLMRTFEHSLRRAGLPLLHSQGYNPRPMLVFALPLGVGISSEDDYLDVSLSENIRVEELIERLGTSLPDGLRIKDGWQVPETKGSIMAMITAARYELQAPGIFCALEKLFVREEILVEKRSKGQLRTLNIRPLMHMLTQGDRPVSRSISAEVGDVASVLVCAGSHENLRPDLLLQALILFEGYPEKNSSNCEVVRTGLYTGTYPDIRTLKEMI
jgi:radical SAM-linked protein